MVKRRTGSGNRVPAAINATFVPRHGHPSSGFLFLWGPERPDRFPWITALQRLGLPIDDNIHFAPATAKLVLPKEGRFRIVPTYGVGISPADALRILGPVRFQENALDADQRNNNRRRYRPTASLMVWSLAAKLALELIARQSMIPTLAKTSHGQLIATWQAVSEASLDVGRVRRLATDMPASAHALLHPMPKKWWERRGKGRRRRKAPRVWHPEAIVKAFLNAAVDDLVRFSAAELNGDVDSALQELYQLPLPSPMPTEPETLNHPQPTPTRDATLPDIHTLNEDDEDDEDGEDGEDGVQLPETTENNPEINPEIARSRRDGVFLSEHDIDTLRRWEYRWLKGLLGAKQNAYVDFHRDDPELLNSFKVWTDLIKNTGATREVDASTGLWLEMPEDSGEESHWYLRYMLVAADDPSLALPAAQVFSVGSSRLRFFEHSFDKPQEKLLADLGIAGRIFEPVRDSLEHPRPEGVFLTTKQAWKFISEAGPVLYASGFDVRLPEELTGQGQRRLRARLRIRDPFPNEIPTEHSLLGLNELAAFQWEAALGDEVISAEEFIQIAELKQPLVRWRGTWVLVDPLQLKSIEDLLDQDNASGTMSRFEALSRALTGLADPNSPNSTIEVIVEGKLRELIERINKDDGGEGQVEIPEDFVGELRPYQERGLSWLVYQARLGLGCCLADDMGLGKTVQLIAQLLHHAQRNPTDTGGTLLICPTSVVGNWQRELARFAPTINVLRHHGPERPSTVEALDSKMRTPNTVVLTTYGLATRDVDILKARRWTTFVLDEAQAIKNATAKRSLAVREIQASFRVALTGTPIENRLSELWSILDFLNPGLLGSHQRFQRAYAIPIERYQDPAALERIRNLVSPFIMRRVKSDPSIIQDLPEKMEMKVYCTLTREQASLYQALVDNAMKDIEDASGITRHGRVLALLTRLKQVVDHPCLYLKASEPSPARSGKLTRLLEMLEEVIETGDRALVFTQFKEMGDVLVNAIQNRFEIEDIPFLHGGVPQSQRDDLVDRFQDEDGPPVFVLSLKAGGTGLNLTAANHVFHFDRWWNPAVEDQATDRAFRIGQTRNVQVHKLISLGSLEEKIDLMLTDKRQLADNIVDSTGAWVTELDTSALRDLVSLSSDATIDDVD